MKKPLIALVVDIKDWAFHNIAKNIEIHLNDKFDFKIFFIEDYKSAIDVLKDLKGYDLVHFFWRDLLHQLLSYETYREFMVYKTHGEYKALIEILKTTKITTSAYDHLLLSEAEILNRTSFYNAIIDEYTVCSEFLNKIYRDIENYPNPKTVIEDGVDLAFFTPKKTTGINEELIIGWAGNSAWGHNIDGVDHKGFHSILKPVLDELKNEGYKIKGFFADKATNYVPRAQMNTYYDTIDVYVCTSDKEGTPNPVLESMAKGIAVISTDVGIVKSVFGKQQSSFILKTRSQKELKKLIVEIYNNRALLTDLRDENLKQIQSWTWKEKSIKWNDFFSFTLNKPLKTTKINTLSSNCLTYSLLLKKEKKTFRYIAYKLKKMVRHKFQKSSLGAKILWKYDILKNKLKKSGN